MSDGGFRRETLRYTATLARGASTHPTRCRSPRHQHPVIEVEDDGALVVVALAKGKIRARTVLGGDGAQAQGGDVVAPRQLRLVQHLGPGEYRLAGEQRRNMTATVDAADVERVGEAVERERAGKRDHVPAIDQPAT